MFLARALDHINTDFSYLKNYSFIVRYFLLYISYPYELYYESIDLICKHYRGEWGMTGMLSLMLYIFGVSADVGSSL